MGNVADARRTAPAPGRLELDVRDPDVPLSDTGRGQAEALGRHLAELPDDERPTAVLSSPFTRALTTAQLAVEPLGLTVCTDERLRERDFGAFDGMTGAGIRDQYPDEAKRRDLLGKFYYRPPGGESWADVALRVAHPAGHRGDALRRRPADAGRPPGRDHGLPVRAGGPDRAAAARDRRERAGGQRLGDPVRRAPPTAAGS